MWSCCQPSEPTSNRYVINYNRFVYSPYQFHSSLNQLWMSKWMKLDKIDVLNLSQNNFRGMSGLVAFHIGRCLYAMTWSDCWYQRWSSCLGWRSLEISACRNGGIGRTSGRWRKRCSGSKLETPYSLRILQISWHEPKSGRNQNLSHHPRRNHPRVFCLWRHSQPRRGHNFRRRHCAHQARISDRVKMWKAPCLHLTWYIDNDNHCHVWDTQNCKNMYHNSLNFPIGNTSFNIG